jgi:hypothetical protein
MSVHGQSYSKRGDFLLAKEAIAGANLYALA